MSSPEAFQAVRALIDADFTAAAVAWPNEPSSADSALPWVYIDVTGTLTRRIELGIGAWEETGTVWCHVFVPVGTGSAGARAVVGALTRLFMSARDSPVRFGDQSTAQGAPGDDDGMFWRQTLTVEYSYQDRSE